MSWTKYLKRPLVIIVATAGSMVRWVSLTNRRDKNSMLANNISKPNRPLPFKIIRKWSAHRREKPFSIRLKWKPSSKFRPKCAQNNHVLKKTLLAKDLLQNNNHFLISLIITHASMWTVATLEQHWRAKKATTPTHLTLRKWIYMQMLLCSALIRQSSLADRISQMSFKRSHSCQCKWDLISDLIRS